MLSSYRRVGLCGYLVVCSTCETFYSHQLMLFWMSTTEDIEGIFTLIFFWQGENTSIFSLKMRCSVHAVQRGWMLPASFLERISLTEESCFLCSVTFHLGIQKALFITPPFGNSQKKMLNFLFCLIFFNVPTETVRMLGVHRVLCPPPQNPRMETFPPGAVTNAVR